LIYIYPKSPELYEGWNSPLWAYFAWHDNKESIEHVCPKADSTATAADDVPCPYCGETCPPMILLAKNLGISVT